MKMILQERKCENNIFEQKKRCPHGCGTMILSKRPVGSKPQEVESNCSKWREAEIQNSVPILLLLLQTSQRRAYRPMGGHGGAKGSSEFHSIALSLPCIISVMPN